MSDSVKLFIHILVCITHCVGCMSEPMETFDFLKHNETDSKFNMLACARLARSEGACGCKMDVYSGVFSSLWHHTWCNNQTLHVRYKFAETSALRIVQPLWNNNVTSEIEFENTIPVCMSKGSVIEIGFKPNDDSSWKLKINIMNKYSKRAMYVNITNGGGKTTFTFMTIIDHIMHNTKVRSFDGLYMAAHETYILVFEVLEQLFKVYVSGTFYYEHSVPVTDISPESVLLRTGTVELQYIEFRK